MFFAALCILLTVLMVTGHPPDSYGWMMLVGLAWLTGYLDCRRFSRSDQESDRVMPRDAIDDAMDDDKALFQ